MPYNEKLADRVREALWEVRKVEEKKMFRGLAFMVNGKMCVNVVHDELMVRIDPAIHMEAIERRGSRTMVMKGREYIGWVLIDEEGWKSKNDFDFWISRALDFNARAKASAKKQPTKRLGKSGKKPKKMMKRILKPKKRK